MRREAFGVVGLRSVQEAQPSCVYSMNYLIVVFESYSLDHNEKEEENEKIIMFLI